MSTSQEQQSFTIRPAIESDLSSVHAIYRYYALNTTIAFLLNDPPLEYITKRYHATLAHGLPYLVAVGNPNASSARDMADTDLTTNIDTSRGTDTNTSTSSNPHTDIATDTDVHGNDMVLGYAHASPFSAGKAGYAPSVEITISCHPTALSRGIGSSLMTRLLKNLKTCRNIHWEQGHEDQKIEVPVRNVFAIVSQDLERQAKENNAAAASRGDGSSGRRREARGEQIVGWYCSRFGFKIAGRMEGVGTKFGRDIDVLYLQKKLA